MNITTLSGLMAIVVMPVEVASMFHVISQEHVIQGSSNFISTSLSEVSHNPAKFGGISSMVVEI